MGYPHFRKLHTMLIYMWDTYIYSGIYQGYGDIPWDITKLLGILESIDDGGGWK